MRPFRMGAGHRRPVDQLASPDVRLNLVDMKQVRLPASFHIRARCCSPQFAVEAVGRSREGVWDTTTVITADNATQHEHETRVTFAARLKWLAGKA